MKIASLIITSALIVLVAATSASAVPDNPRCTRENLSLKEGETDAAMGGVRMVDFAFKNTSSSPCTLKGYPQVGLLDKKGIVSRRAVGNAELPGAGEKTPPQTITLDAGKTATFSIYYNSGGAGHIGKPCPTYPKVRILAPGTKRPFVLRTDIQSCGKSEFQVSAVRVGPSN